MCTTIDSPAYKEKLHPVVQPQESATRRRHVQFSDERGDGTYGEIVTAVYPMLQLASEMSDEEKQAIWWSNDDFLSFRLMSRRLGKEAIRSEGKEDLKSYKVVVLKVQQACERFEEPTAKQRDDLKQWITATDSRRGIERLCIPEVHALRAERIRSTVQSVLWAQEYCSEMSWDCKAEFTRVLSEIRTRGARSFARLLGDCDAHSATSKAARGVRRSSQQATLLKFKSFQRKELFNTPSTIPALAENTTKLKVGKRWLRSPSA